MTTRSYLSIALLLALVLGCAVSSPLTPGGAQVQVVTQNSVSDGCTLLAPLTVKKGNGLTAYAENYEQAMNEVRNQAAARGATHVVLNQPVMLNPSDPTLSAVSLTGMALVCR